MSYRKYKANYRITAEMLSLILFGEHINIETIEFDKSREVLDIYVSGDFLKKYGVRYEMCEGDEHPGIRITRDDDGKVRIN